MSVPISPFKIYTLNDPDTNEIRYLGYTSKTLKERLRGHIKDVKREVSNGHKDKWIRKMLSQNKTPIIVLVSTYETKEEALFNEVKMIFEYRLSGVRLTNSTDGGEGSYNHVFTEEQIKKMSLAQLGSKKGPCSEERKRKISEANKGRKISEEAKDKMRSHIKTEEHREKLRLFNLGKKLSDDTKKKMSERMKRDWEEGKLKPTRKGMKNSEEHKEKMRGEKNPFYGKKHSPELMAIITEKGRQTRLRKKLEKNKND